MLRPARASDVDGIRELFFKLPATDIYTRFFRHAQALPNKDIGRLCNFSYENEVGFVAEILAENASMIALARKGSDNVAVEKIDDTVYVTMLF